MAALAAKRGLNLSPRSAGLSDPFLFPEMTRAVDRIRAAMQGGEHIAVFGDYDADGITAAAQFARFFRRHGNDAKIHLPQRSDGYGMTSAFIAACAAKRTSLIITVDTGIAAHAEIEEAKRRGIDVIVTDHHSASRGRPPAFAVIHPTLPSAFPNVHLSGSGVAYCVIRALETSMGSEEWRGMEEDLLLATIGTVADLVPLVGENRTLVTAGLSCAARLPSSSPLARLIRAGRGDGGPLKSSDIAFRIAPRINASGRIADPALALEAILSGEGIEELLTLNEERKAMTDDLMRTAERMIDDRRLFLCAADSSFPAGIIGLLAGRITESRGKPSLIAHCGENLCTASLRSVPGIDVTAILGASDVSRFLLTWGGHSQAAGCTFAPEHFESIRDALEEELRRNGITEDDLCPTLSLDAEVSVKDLNEDVLRSLASLEPFGHGNEEPVFLLRNGTMTDARTVGGTGEHLQCRIGGVKGIAFRLGHLLERCAEGTLDIACRLQANTWNGRSELQLVIVDIRHHVPAVVQTGTKLPST